MLISSFADAAGLGKISVLSPLGQPLKAEIDIVSLQPGEFDSLQAGFANKDSFKQAGIEFNPILSSVSLSIATRSGGQPYVKLTSSQAINEPFLDVLIELNWSSGRLLREYTLLLDPVEYKPASAPVQLTVMPAPLPAPKVEAAKPTLPSEQTYGPVKHGETLGKIAAKMKPAEVSLDQMLVALYRSNEGAFDRNNMNQLKTGKILRIPKESEIASVAPPEAKKEINAQAANWNAYRQTLASAAAEKPAEIKQSVSGKITTKVEDKAAPVSSQPKEVLKLSKGGSAKAEDESAKAKELKEASERIVVLEKNIQDMRKLLELKGQALPEMPASAPAPAKQPASAVVAPKVRPVMPKPAPEPSFLEDMMGNPMLIVAVGAVLIGGLALALLRRRKAKEEAPKEDIIEPLAEQKFVVPMPEEAPPAEPIDKENLDFDLDFETLAGKDVDLDLAELSEAPAQEKAAVTEISEEIAQPVDLEIGGGAEESVTEVPADNGVDFDVTEMMAPSEERAAEAPLDFEISEPAAEEAAMEFEVPSLEEAKEEEPVAVEEAAMEFEVPSLEEAKEEEPVAAEEAAMEFEVPSLEEAEEEPVAAEEAAMEFEVPSLEEAKEEEPVAVEEAAMEFEIPSLEEAKEEEPVAVEEEEPVAVEEEEPVAVEEAAMEFEVPSLEEAEEEEPVAVEEEAMEFEIPSLEEANEAEPALAEVAPVSEEAPLDLDIPELVSSGEVGIIEEIPEETPLDRDVKSESPFPEMPETKSPEPASEKTAFDLSAIPSLSDDSALSGIDLDLGEKAEGMEIHDASWYEVATKLDLATVYQEMGDIEGAKEILAEVIKEGDEGQRATAEAILAGLS